MWHLGLVVWEALPPEVPGPRGLPYQEPGRRSVEVMAWVCEPQGPVPPGLAPWEENTCSCDPRKSYWVPSFGQLKGVIHSPLLWTGLAGKLWTRCSHSRLQACILHAVSKTPLSQENGEGRSGTKQLFVL